MSDSGLHSPTPPNSPHPLLAKVGKHGNIFPNSAFPDHIPDPHTLTSIPELDNTSSETSDYDVKEEKKVNLKEVDEEENEEPPPLTPIPEEEEDSELGAKSRKADKQRQEEIIMTAKEKFMKDRENNNHRDHSLSFAMSLKEKLARLEDDQDEDKQVKFGRSQSYNQNRTPSKWSTFETRRTRSARSLRKKASRKGEGQSGSTRRKSVLVTVFGEGHSRRFSGDLIPRPKRTISLASTTGDPVQPKDDLPSGSDYQPIVQPEETSRVIFFQVFIPFLVAGFDNVGAGVILDIVQYWTVFKTIPELFILVASFLGLKGNLEMTLAARLATSANLGHLDKSSPTSTKASIALGNIFLVQGQAIVVAFLASVIAIVVNFFKEPDFDVADSLVIFLTALITASITGLAMASLMFTATVIARRIGVNPDNVSALTASIMGDISAIGLLAILANKFHNLSHTSEANFIFYGNITIGSFLLVLPVFLFLARMFKYTKDVVGSGWIPIISAMFISSIAGFVFDVAVGFFDTIAVVQPIINGVGGNLIAVQASRISTYFHLRVPLGHLPQEDDDDGKIKDAEDGGKSSKKLNIYHGSSCPSPISAFIGRNTNVKTARMLLAMSIPIHGVYLLTIYLLKRDQMTHLTVQFTLSYFLVVIVQMASLFYAAHVLVPYLWGKAIDPDNASVPALMSLADLLGTCFLTFAYFVLYAMGDAYVGHSIEPSNMTSLVNSQIT